MTKDEKTRIEVRDEVEYVCSPVRHGKQDVGFAPRRKSKDLDEMLGFLSPEKVWSLADRQYDQDNKNAVRAKFTKDAVSATQAIKYYDANPDDREEIARLGRIVGMTFTKAVEKLMGVGKDAKVEPEKIHWDIL